MRWLGGRATHIGRSGALLPPAHRCAWEHVRGDGPHLLTASKTAQLSKRSTFLKVPQASGITHILARACQRCQTRCQHVNTVF